MQERRDAGKEGFRKEEIQERRDSGKKGFRKGGMHERKDAEKEGLRKGMMQESAFVIYPANTKQVSAFQARLSS